MENVSRAMMVNERWKVNNCGALLFCVGPVHAEPLSELSRLLRPV